MTDWTIITRSLTSRLFSTVTTVLTVAVAVGLLLVLLMLRQSAGKVFERGTGNMHLLVSADASAMVSVLNAVFYANAPQRALTWAKYQELTRAFPLEFAVPTQQGDSFRGQPVMATTPEFFTKFRPSAERDGAGWELAEGRFFESPFEVVVGAQAARATGVRVGQQIVLTHGVAQSRLLGSGGVAPGAMHEHEEYPFTVVGVLEPTGTAHDRAVFTTLTASWLMHAQDKRVRENAGATLATEADLADGDRLITGVYMRLITREGSDVPANMPQVFSMLRRDPTVTVAAPADEVRRLRTIIGGVDQIFIALAGAVLVSSGIAIMLALYNSMEQRRRQIAVLRVLGCSRGRVFGLVLTESAVLGVAGALAGLVLAVAASGVATAALKEQLGIAIFPRLEPGDALGVAALTIVLACVAGIVPAVMAYRTSVAKNLRPLG